MFEVILPTTRTTRYQYHQLLADFREVHNLENARLQCASLGSHLYIRSEKQFPGAHERTLKTTGEIEFIFDYSCERVISTEDGGRKSLVKDRDQVMHSITRALQDGGLTNIEFSIGTMSWEPLKKGIKHNIPIVRVTGQATIGDPVLFRELVLTGIGKRRSFGLGMLQLGGGAYAD